MDGPKDISKAIAALKRLSQQSFPYIPPAGDGATPHFQLSGMSLGSGVTP